MILSTFANNNCHIFINLHESLLLRYWDHLGSDTAEGLGCQGPNEHIKCNCYCHLHVHYIILTKFYQVISIFIFLIFGSLGRPGRGVGVDQGPNEYLFDIKCNCYCHLHVHYIILTKFYQVISIFIFLIFGVLCGKVRLGWGPDGGDWTIWYGQIYIYFDSIYPYHYIYGIIFHG